jgi:uncharacterized ferredoxin-like protein
VKTSAQLETQAVLQVGALMAAAARTAPKTRGIDNIRVLAIDDEPTKRQVVEQMRALGTTENRPSFSRDAGNVEASAALLVIGVLDNPAGLNCGYCGKPTCEALQQQAGICAFNSIDLGIATAAAAAVAGRLHIDNRLMFSIGRAALELKLFGAEPVRQALGIPLSVTGKSPYFDRKA